MKTRLYDHIDLRVSDMEAAKPFYAQLLPAVGFTEPGEDNDWFSRYATGEEKPPFFGITLDPAHRPNGNRISFWADTREEVNRVAEVVKKAGGRALEGPELCVEYTPGYYAFFFEDPSGNKLEICCRLPQD